MTLIPTIFSALITLPAWPYMRHSLKRNLVSLFQTHHLWIFGFDFLFFFGTYFITGNHEYYWYTNDWVEWARNSNMIPLLNENIKLNHKGTDFYLAGVSDRSSIKLDLKNSSDPKKAAIGIPTEAYKILLAHQPISCFQACKEGFHTQLSGHTYAGRFFEISFI